MKTTELSADKFLRDWAAGGGARGAAAQLVLMQIEDYLKEIGRLEAERATAVKITRDIHETIKRGKVTQDHGLIGNLQCVLDHICRKYDPPPA